MQKITPQKQSENSTEYYQSVTEDFFDPETSLEDLVEPSVKIEVFEEVKEDSVQPIDFTLVDNDTKLNYLGEIEESDELDSCIVDDDRGPESLGEYIRTCRNGKCGCKKGKFLENLEFYIQLLLTTLNLYYNSG